MNELYGNGRISTRAFFENIDPERKHYDTAIKYAKEHNVNIYKTKELKKLYETVNERILELSKKIELDGENNEYIKELEYLDEVFYGLVGLLIDNKNQSMNHA